MTDNALTAANERITQQDAIIEHWQARYERERAISDKLVQALKIAMAAWPNENSNWPLAVELHAALAEVAAMRKGEQG